jgi:ketosteroid isomerase-like protein
MKKLFMVLPLVLLLCFTFSCQQYVEEVAEEPGVKPLSDEDVAAIKKLLADQAPLILAGDWEGYGQLFTEDVMIMPPNTPLMKGRAVWGQMFGGATFTEFNSNLIEVHGYGDIAYGRGTVTLTFQFEGAEESISESAKWIAIFRKQPDGKWLIAVDIWNSDLPLPE